MHFEIIKSKPCAIPDEGERLLVIKPGFYPRVVDGIGFAMLTQEDMDKAEQDPETLGKFIENHDSRLPGLRRVVNCEARVVNLGPPDPSFSNYPFRDFQLLTGVIEQPKAT